MDAVRWLRTVTVVAEEHAKIQSLIDKGYLEQVPANPDEAAHLIDKAPRALYTQTTSTGTCPPQRR